jgi:hypothetical protein
VKPARKRNGQIRSADYSIEQSDQIQMTNQSHIAHLPEPNPQTLFPLGIRHELPGKLWNWQRIHNHIVSEIGAANPAARTPFKGTVGNRRCF